MNSAFGESFMFLTKLAWNCKVTLPILVTAVFLALDFRMQIELNIETEQIVFQDDIDDDDETESVEEETEEDSDDDDVDVEYENDDNEFDSTMIVHATNSEEPRDDFII